MRERLLAMKELVLAEVNVKELELTPTRPG